MYSTKQKYRGLCNDFLSGILAVVTSTSEESTLKKPDKNSKDLIADVADVSKRHHPVKKPLYDNSRASRAV